MGKYLVCTPHILSNVDFFSTPKLWRPAKNWTRLVHFHDDKVADHFYFLFFLFVLAATLFTLSGKIKVTCHTDLGYK